MKNDEVGFKTYQWGGRNVVLQDVKNKARQKEMAYFIDDANMYFKPPPPAPKVNKLVALYREIKSRLKGCYDILRYGVDYYD